jgi:hypothetical protein
MIEDLSGKNLLRNRINPERHDIQGNYCHLLYGSGTFLPLLFLIGEDSKG